MASALEDRPPPQATDPRTGRPPLAEQVRHMGPRELTPLVLMVALLALLPAVASLARSSVYHAEVRLVAAQPRESTLPAGAEDQVLRWTYDQPAAAALAGFLDREWLSYGSLYPLITARADGRSTVVLRVPGRTPDEAHDVARVVAGRVISNSQRQASGRERTSDELAGVKRRLREPGLSASERRRLNQRRGFLASALPSLSDTVELKTSDQDPHLTLNIVDRAIVALPGDPPPPPSPVWAAVAGLLLGAALCSVWVLLRGPDRKRPTRP